ncbi:MAG: RpiB/LacA/LacB family sugar-phosphate isomerase [Acidimicrobiales bacterium]
MSNNHTFAVTGPVAVAADHNGVELKALIVSHLLNAGIAVDDLGTDDPDSVVDYPPLCAKLCRHVTSAKAQYGIFIGGTGQGEVIACNKIKGIRAGGCHNTLTAEVSRGNNDANVLVIGSKLLGPAQAWDVVETWLSTTFKGGRHAERLAMIEKIEQGVDL